MTVRSSLARFFGRTPADGSEIRGMAARIWHARRGLFIPEGALKGLDADLVETLGARLYGARNKEAGHGSA